jgi:molybdopterin synthase sulfur carrier subunit
MAVLRLFAAAREEAGVTSERFDAATVGAVLDQAVDRYGPGFAAVLAGSRVWLNGDPGSREQAVTDKDEVAVLPPVSGG